MLPSLLISHGSPMLPLIESPPNTFLEGLSASLERPKGTRLSTPSPATKH
jgi:hypothetical protein